MGRFTVNEYKDKSDRKSITGMLLKRLKEISIFSGQNEFLDSLGIKDACPASYSNDRLSLFGGDFYDKYISMIDWDRFWNKLNASLKNGTFDEKSINDILYSILSDSDMYLNTGTRNWTAAGFTDYDTLEKTKLEAFYNIKADCFDLAYNIYLMVYFAVNKKLPDNFMYGLRYNKDLKEFNKVVIGGPSAPNTFPELLVLATRDTPNVFALFELADTYYYGDKRLGIIKDISKAFDLYEIASGLVPPPGNKDCTICHPLAIWSLSFILFNYHRKGYSLENCDTIKKIEDRYGDNICLRIKKALEYASYAKDILEVDRGEPDNIFGKAALVSEEECPGIEDLRKELNMKTADEYFTSAADKGYVLALNNLSMLENDRMFTDPKNKNTHLKKTIEYLKRGSDLLNPWASNTLGKLYLTGIAERREFITYGARTESKQVMAPTMANKEEAFNYFKKAAELFLDHNSAWAICNLILEFPDYYKHNQNELKELIRKLETTDNTEAKSRVKENLHTLYGLNYEDCCSF